MHNHEPDPYVCPFCLFIRTGESEYNRATDVVYEDTQTLAFLSPKWWQKNPGNVLVIPKRHVENIYDISDTLLAKVYRTAKKVGCAIKQGYGCDGISFRQHNEPMGNQDVWHFHVHVFPRWAGDDLYANHAKRKFVSSEQRLPYATILKALLQDK